MKPPASREVRERTGSVLSSGGSDTEFVMVEEQDISNVVCKAEEHVKVPPLSVESGVDTLQTEGVWSDADEVEALGRLEARDAQEQLMRETKDLDRERKRQERAAASVSNTMYKDAQVKLQTLTLAC